MAVGQGMSRSETTIASVASCLKSDLLCLREDLEKFIKVGVVKEDTQKSPSILDPLSEIMATLQDCRTVITEIRRLSIDRIAKRITD